jgi:hypothetical protein
MRLNNIFGMTLSCMQAEKRDRIVAGPPRLRQRLAQPICPTGYQFDACRSVGAPAASKTSSKSRARKN